MNFFKKLFGINEEDKSVSPKPYMDESKKRSTSIDEIMENKHSSPVVEEALRQTNSSENNSEKKEIEADLKTQAETTSSPFADPSEWIIFKKNGKKGYRDPDDRIMVEPKFDEAYFFKENLAPVKVGEFWGMINSKGEYLLKPEFSMVAWVKEEMVLIEKNELWGFADAGGKIIIEPQYDFAGEFCEGLSAVSTEGNAGFIDKQNKIAIPFKFEETGDFSEGLAYAAPLDSEEYKGGFIDKTGEFVISPQFFAAGHFREGLAPVEINEKWAYINKQGKLICEPVYHRANDFHSGLSCVQNHKDGLWGFADKTGKLFVPFQFDYESDFMEDGTAYVFLKGKCFTLHPDGKMHE